MNEWRRTRFGNPAAWYTGIGILLLAFSLWIPWLSATRTARVETRGDRLANALLDATEGFLLPLDEADLQILLSRFYLTAASRGVRIKEVKRVEPAPDGSLLFLTNKHYCFQLSETPLDPQSRPGKNTVASLEVVAWPLNAASPGHCVYFYPQDASRAYSRNLRRGYRGIKKNYRPEPGACHRRPGGGGARRAQYPGIDDERWILY